MGSAFAGVNLHRKKRFKSVQTKEFSALADDEGKSSELAKFLFGEDLSEKIKEQMNQTKSQGMWLRQTETKIRVNLWMFHVGILFPGEGKGSSEDLPTGKGTRKRQQSTGQCRPNLQPNIRTNFPKDSKLFGQMNRVNKQSRDFRYCFRLSAGFHRDPSSAETSNSIQPVQGGGKAGGFGGGETSEEGCYRGGGTLQKSISVEHFTIPKKGGGRRLVEDMRDLNSFIELVHFKMEDLSYLPSILWRGHFMCKIDLQDAYQTIPIAKKSRIYLRFLWKGRLYQFTCLPFGLRSSPRIFTKVLKPLLVYLRALGVRLLVYLDNILIMAATPELCLEHTKLTWQLLTDLGFPGNLKKSVLNPKQQTEYLGFLLNSIEMKLFLMEEKLLRSKLEAECLLKSVPVVKMLASFLGFCQSPFPAIAVTPLHFRKLQADMIKAIKGSGGRQGYQSVVHLSPEAKKELEW